MYQSDWQRQRYVEGYAAKGGGPDCGDGAVILESAVGLGSVSLTVNGR